MRTTRSERRRRRRERDRGRHGRRGPLRRLLGAAVTAVYVVIAAVLLAQAVTPFLAGLEWRIDLVAQFSAHAATLTLAAAIWWSLWRRWRLAAAGAVALVVHAAVLLPGRAAWADRAERASVGDASTTGKMGEVRVLQFNAHALNRVAEPVLRLVLESDADIVSLMEPSWPVLNAGFRDRLFQGAYPYFDQHPRASGLGWQYLMSKWPIREFRPRQRHMDPNEAVALVVERPGGAFGVVQIHPQSPRVPRRWRQGNDLVERTAEIVREMKDAGLPVVVVGDFNSTPSGWRSRALVRRAGLARCKPLWVLEGTYPTRSEWPPSRNPLKVKRGGGEREWSWPMRIAIDDAMVSPEIRVSGWDVAGPAGSDHMAVVVDLLVPMGVPNTQTPGSNAYELLGLP